MSSGDFQYLTNVQLDIAKAGYMEALIRNGMAPRTETIPVTEANGRCTAGPVYARICAPHYNASAMDGIAVDARLTLGASKSRPVTLSNGQFVRVSTGDPLPDGCNAVIMIEDVAGTGSATGARGGGRRRASGSDGGVTISEAAVPWKHIRQIGEDISTGEMILPSFSPISPSAIGAMIAGGVAELAVVKRPVVGVIPIGDDLVPPTSAPGGGDIFEFNSAIFSSMLRDWGAETITFPIIKDELPDIRKALGAAVSECDIVILNAGSPPGGEDCLMTAIAEVGAVLYQGLAIKPGRTAILGCSGSKPVMGVPGYPVSGIIVIEELLKPIIGYLCRRTPENPRFAEASLSKSLVSTLEYREFVRVRLGYVKGQLIASPLNRGSGVVTSFMKADGIVEVPNGAAGYENGEKVEVRLLRPEDELRRSLVVTGSHDPLIDELHELLCVKYGNVSMGSAHVGSMGGLIAVRRGKAHVAGTHLLDEDTGEYNVSFVRKTFPKGGVRLIECVKRTQGLILAKGNPKSIKGVADLTMEGLRYVNRQKGSGTRILLDYYCRENAVDTSEIDGYEREEYTHNSVAALIVSGSADAGLGIFSVAKLHDLDFIPVCQEQYDLLIPDHAWELQMVRQLLDVLRSDEFRQRMGELGGYVVEDPGRVIIGS